MPVQPRDISPILQALREFLLGRPHTTALRFEQFLASRSPPPPCIPDGATHKISANYYYTRDVRREVHPATLIASATKQIDVAKDVETTGTVGVKKLPTPGNVYHWD